jgi:hypothetical protein
LLKVTPAPFGPVFSPYEHASSIILQGDEVI